MQRLSAFSVRLFLVLPFILTFGFLVGVQVRAQEDPGEGDRNGVIAGTIVSEEGGPLVDVLVLVKGTAFGTTTDLQGRYRIADVPPGRYDLSLAKKGYRRGSITDVRVRSGKVTKVDFPLPEEDAPYIAGPTEDEDEADDVTGGFGGGIEELEAFTITAEEAVDLGAALLADRQQAVSISDAIGSEDFSRLGVGDAAEAMSKVTGASVVDGKYVVVRGLGDRYSNTTLNGNSLPSADPDRKAVQMDQFPADLLESIVTSKSFTPDKPGDFAGGNVNIRTRSFPEQFFYSLSGSITYDSLATGEDIFMVDRDFGDNFAFSDREGPTPPEELPTEGEARRALRFGDPQPLQELDSFVREFDNENFLPDRQTAAPDFGISGAFGDTIDLGEGSRIGYTLSLSYDRSTAFAEGQVGRYVFSGFDNTLENRRQLSPNRDDFTQSFNNDLDQASGFLDEFEELGVEKSSIQNSLGFFSKVAYQPSTRHEVSLDLFHNRSGDDQVLIGVGQRDNESANGLVQVYDLLYTERSVTSAQLNGSHVFGETDDWEIEWRAALSESTQDQPDYRTVTLIHGLDDREDFITSNADTPPITRRFRDLTEKSEELGVDVTKQILIGDYNLELKFGGNYVDGSRDYNEDGFVYARRIGALTNQGIYEDPFNELENFPQPVGIVQEDPLLLGQVVETDNQANNYDGERTITAAYAMLELPVTEKLETIFGVRMEDTEIELTPAPSPINPEPGTIDQTDYLPAFHLVYEVMENMNIRLAYGETVARPTYKELGDISIEDDFTGDIYQGNPDLEMSQIQNYDLRWEWFPRPGEIVAASVFYKSLENPIEVIQNQSGRIEPQNVEEGTVYGAEFEFRRAMDFINPALRDLSVGTNFALIESEVSVPEEELENARQGDPDFPDKRDFVDQSPFTFNADLTYNLVDWDTTVTAVYNVVGERLTLVLPGRIPDVFEQSAPKLDLLIAKNFGDRWKLKFSAKNLLAPDQEEILELDGEEFIYDSFETSRSFSLSLTYSFE